MYYKGIDSCRITVLWVIILHANSRSCWHHPRCQAIVRIQALIFCRTMAWALADAFVVGQVAFVFPVQLELWCSSYLVTARSIVNKISKRKVSVQHCCEDKILLAAKSYARGRFAISVYNLNTEMNAFLTHYKRAHQLLNLFFVCFVFCCEEMFNSRNPEVQKVETESFFFFLSFYVLFCFSSLAAGYLPLFFVFKW